jgi:membrane protein involved in colicin uptake
MTDNRPTEVLGGLPRTRPHRRSDKRATRASETAPAFDKTTETERKPRAAAERKPRAAERKPRAAAERKPRAAAEGKPRAAAERKPRSAAGRKPTQPTPIRGQAARKPPSQRLRQPAQPAGTPVARRERAAPSPPSGTELVGTVVHAAAELAEIGLTASTRALRNALARLPRP